MVVKRCADFLETPGKKKGDAPYGSIALMTAIRAVFENSSMRARRGSTSVPGALQVATSAQMGLLRPSVLPSPAAGWPHVPAAGTPATSIRTVSAGRSELSH